MGVLQKFQHIIIGFLCLFIWQQNSAYAFDLSEQCQSELDEIFSDPTNEDAVKSFLKLQANLTTHRLAWTFAHNSNQEESFKLENEILAILEQMDENQDPAFIQARDQFRNHQLSRKALAEIMPFIAEILEQQASDINNNNQRFFHLKAGDLKLLSLLGSRELDPQGNLDARFFQDNTQDQSILNLTKIVNSSLRGVQTDDQIETFQESINRYMQSFDQLFKNLSDFDYASCFQDYQDRTCRSDSNEFNQKLIDHIMELLKASDSINEDIKFENLRYGSIWLNLNRESSGLRNQRVNRPPARAPEVDVQTLPQTLPSRQDSNLIPGTRIPANTESQENINLEDFPALLEEYINIVMGHYNHFFTREYLRENPELAFQLARALERREASENAGEEPDNIFYYPNSDGTYTEMILPEIDPNDTLMERVSLLESVPYQDVLDELNTLNEGSTEKRWPCGFRSPSNGDFQVSSYNGQLRRTRDNTARRYRDALRDSYRLRTNTAEINQERAEAGQSPLPRMVYYSGTFCDTQTGFRVNNTVESFLEVSTPSGEPRIVNEDEAPVRPTEAQALSIYEALLERPDQAGISEGSLNRDGIRPLTFIDQGEVRSITGMDYSLNQDESPELIQARVEGRPYFINDEGRLASTTEPESVLSNSQVLAIIQERNPDLSVQITEENYGQVIAQADAISRGALVYNSSAGVRFTSSGNLIENCDNLQGEVDREIRRGCNSYARRMQEEFLNNTGDNERVIHQYEASADNECGFYTVANKQTGYLSVYNTEGVMVFNARALYGEETGDQRTQRLNGFDGDGGVQTNNKTGAGSYTMVVQRGDDDYEHPYYTDNYNGNILEVRASSGSPFSQGGNSSTVMAVHAPPNIGSRQERVDALAIDNPTQAQIRMSGGCINISEDNYLALQELLSQNAGSGEFECPLYVLPEEGDTRFELRNGELVYAPVSENDPNICDDSNGSSSNGCSTDYYFTPDSGRTLAGLPADYTPTPIDIQIEDSLFDTVDKPGNRALSSDADIRDEMRYYSGIFIESLEDNKELIMNTFNNDSSSSNDMTDAEYNDLARLALGFMRVETTFCTNRSTEVMIESTFGENAFGQSPSIGCTQIKNPSVLFERSGIDYELSDNNLSPDRTFRGTPDRSSNQDGVRDSAVATILYLHQALNTADRIGVRNLIRRDEYGQMTNYEEVLYHLYQGRSAVAFNDANTSASSTTQVRRIRGVLGSINIRRVLESQ